jgi:hypothetical protein
MQADKRLPHPSGDGREDVACAIFPSGCVPGGGGTGLCCTSRKDLAAFSTLLLGSSLQDPWTGLYLSFSLCPELYLTLQSNASLNV